jgi:tetratricopeptide (TPR) repeat protein
MISDPTRHRAQNSSAFRCVAATALFLSAILGASAALAHLDFRYGSPDNAAPNPQSIAPPPAGGSVAPPAGGNADLKTCDKGLVWDAKIKKCIIKRSGVEQDEGLTDLTVCFPGQVWDMEHHECLQRRSGVLPDSELTEYAFALAKADRYQEAIDVLDLLDNPNTARALNCRGYATRKLGRTDEGISYYLKSVELDPNYPQVREYLGEAYTIQGKYDLAKEQLSTIEKLCGSDCEYYQDLADALAQAHAL